MDCIANSSVMRSFNFIIAFHLLCSVSSPYNLILLASCCAFFFNRHARDANLFFSLRNLGRSLNGDSFTDVIWFMVRPNLSNSLPMQCNFRGFGVKSFPSPFRAFPLCCNLRNQLLNFCLFYENSTTFASPNQ